MDPITIRLFLDDNEYKTVRDMIKVMRKKREDLGEYTYYGTEEWVNQLVKSSTIPDDWILELTHNLLLNIQFKSLFGLLDIEPKEDLSDSLNEIIAKIENLKVDNQTLKMEVEELQDKLNRYCGEL